MIFRPTSIFFAAHVAVTLYAELYTWWYKIITQSSSTSEPIMKLPVQVVWKEMLGLDTTKEARTAYMVEQNHIFMKLESARLEFVIFASINLILILSLTWKNISESKQIRLMVTSMSKSIFDLLAFLILLFIVFSSFVLYIANCFGFGFEDTKDLSYAAMTLFKMFIGKNIGKFFRATVQLAPLSAYLFIFAFASMFFMSNSIILVIVSLHYEKEVLGQEVTSDIKFMQAICFCNISL